MEWKVIIRGEKVSTRTETYPSRAKAAASLARHHSRWIVRDDDKCAYLVKI